MSRIPIILLILSFCTCVRAQKDTSDLWRNADLTGHLMKPYPIAEKVLRKAQRNNLPWTAVAGTVVAGGVIVAVVTNPNDSKPPPNTVDDEIIVSCAADFIDLFPLLNDNLPLGKVIDVVIYSSEYSARVLNDSVVRISDFNTLDSLVVGIRINSEEGISTVSDFTVRFNTVPIVTRPDAYEVVYREILSANLLDNDTGAALKLIGLSRLNDAQPMLASRTSFQENGDFTFEPRPELRGTVLYQYIVEDRCGVTQVDTVSFSVIDSPCGFNVDFSRREDVCGIGAGILEARVENGNDFSYAWSSGQNVARADGLSPGIYELTITDPATNCSEVITEEVGPGDPNLEIISNVSVDHCTSPPLLSFRLGSVRLDDFEVEIEGNGIDFPPRPFARGNRTLPLEDIPPGNYNLIAYPAGFPDACRTVRPFTILPTTPIINFSIIGEEPPCMGETGSITLLLDREADQPFNIVVATASPTQSVSGDTVVLTGLIRSTNEITVFNNLGCPSATQSFTFSSCFQPGTTITTGLFQPVFRGGENSSSSRTAMPGPSWDILWLNNEAIIPFGFNARLSINPSLTPAETINLFADVAVLKSVYSSRQQHIVVQMGLGVNYDSSVIGQSGADVHLANRLYFKPAWLGAWRLSGWVNYAPFGTAPLGLVGGCTLSQPMGLLSRKTKKRRSRE